MSPSAVLAASTGSASSTSVATDPVTPSLEPQCANCSLGYGGNEDGEEEVLEGSVYQVTPLISTRSSKDSWETEDILNILKVSQEQTKKQIHSTLAASSPDVKKSWCLWIEANVKDVDPFLWRSFRDQLYQMITQYVDQSAIISMGSTA